MTIGVDLAEPGAERLAVVCGRQGKKGFEVDRPILVMRMSWMICTHCGTRQARGPFRVLGPYKGRLMPCLTCGEQSRDMMVVPDDGTIPVVNEIELEENS
jgi:hypothetical protein